MRKFASILDHFGGGTTNNEKSGSSLNTMLILVVESGLFKRNKLSLYFEMSSSRSSDSQSNSYHLCTVTKRTNKDPMINGIAQGNSYHLLSLIGSLIV